MSYELDGSLSLESHLRPLPSVSLNAWPLIQRDTGETHCVPGLAASSAEQRPEQRQTTGQISNRGHPLAHLGSADAALPGRRSYCESARRLPRLMKRWLERGDEAKGRRRVSPIVPVIIPVARDTPELKS